MDTPIRDLAARDGFGVFTWMVQHTVHANTVRFVRPSFVWHATACARETDGSS